MDSKVACIFWRLILSQLFICSYFLPFWGFCFYLAFSFLCCTNDFKFNQVPLVIFIFISIILGCGEGSGTPLQYSCLENPMDEGAWETPWSCSRQSMELLKVGHDWVTSLSLSCIGEGNGNPLWCSCLENPLDGGAWWAAVYGVAQSRTRLKRLSSISSSRRWVIEDIVVTYVKEDTLRVLQFPRLTFKYLIHFEFTFVYGVRKCSNFILLHMAVQFSQPTYWRDYLFSIVYSCLFCQR